jgi:hypothetical protein
MTSHGNGTCRRIAARHLARVLVVEVAAGFLLDPGLRIGTNSVHAELPRDGAIDEITQLRYADVLAVAHGGRALLQS